MRFVNETRERGIEKDEREQDYWEKLRIDGGRRRDVISAGAIARGRRDRDGGRYDGADKAAGRKDGSNKSGRVKGAALKCENVKKIKCVTRAREVRTCK